MKHLFQRALQEIRKVTNGFRLMYQEYKLIKVWKEKNRLSWRDLQCYRESPIYFMKCKTIECLQRGEIEQVKKTLKSMRKLGLFFVIQLVPILGYIPIAFSVIYPRILLTYHFWNDQQIIQFREEHWQERHLACVRLIVHKLKIEQDFVSDTSFHEYLTSRRSSLQSDLLKDSPFPKFLYPLLRDRYYLILLAQSQGFFTFIHPSLLILFPKQYFRRKLRYHVHEIINDDYLLQTKLKNKEDFHKLSPSELVDILSIRGFRPLLDQSSLDQQLFRYHQYWKESSIITGYRNQLQDVHSISADAELFNFAKVNREKISPQELLLLHIAWNTLRFHEPIQSLHP